MKNYNDKMKVNGKYENIFTHILSGVEWPFNTVQ